MEESSITSDASSRSEKKARKAAKKAAKKSKSSKDNRDFQSNAVVGIGYGTAKNPGTSTNTADSSAVNSAGEEEVPLVGEKAKDRAEKDTFSAEEGNVDPSFASYPTTPFTQVSNKLLTTLTANDFTALANSTKASVSPKSTKNNKSDPIVSTTWAGMFADPVTTDTEALQAEQSVLNAELKEWASSYSAKHGRKPVPSDYDSFDTEIKAKIYRKNYIKKVLKDDAASVFSGMSGGVTDSPTAEWRAKQIPPPSEFSPSAHEHKTAQQPVYDINTDPNIYSTNTTNSNAVNNRHNADGDSQSGFSLPTTPFLKNHSFNDDTVEEFPDSVSLEEQLANGKVTVESLLQEQAALREEVRQWTQEFIVAYDRRPAVEDFQSFDTDIKLKLIRKNQIKKLLQDFGITSSVSRKYGASSDFGVVLDELTEEQLEAIRAGRPNSNSANRKCSVFGSFSLGCVYSPNFLLMVPTTFVFVC